jgi:hypothetical protein
MTAFAPDQSVNSQGIGDVEYAGVCVATVSYVLRLAPAVDPQRAAPAASCAAGPVASGSVWRLAGDLWAVSDGRAVVLRLSSGQRLRCCLRRGPYPDSPAVFETLIEAN